MNIDHNLIQKLQKLSLLDISEQEEKETIVALQEIVDFTDNLNSLDLSDIKEIHFNPAQGYSILREDIANKKEDISKDILDNAPLVENNFFVVPNIIN